MSSKNRFAMALMGLATVFVLASFVQAQERVVDKKGRVLTKVTFIHFRKAPGRPPGVGGGGGGKTDSGSYTYLAKGAKWRAPGDVYLNTHNGDSTAPADLVQEAADFAMDEWETHDSATLDIFKDTHVATEYSPGNPIAYNNGAHRGYNTISFGDYSGNVIAVTTVWGIFGGPADGREITEAHILLNDAFTWGDATQEVDPDGDGSPDDVMDVQNILTHELGHWVGMGDLYQGGATEETMYGYSTEGEIKKRDLYKGDIAGVTKLYQP